MQKQQSQMVGPEMIIPKRTIFDELTPAEMEEMNDITNTELLLGISSTGLPQSSRSAKGFTLDTTIIVNTVARTVRSLWADGLLRVVTSSAVEGTGIAAHTVSLYEAEFVDRVRSFVITEETYRALNEGMEPMNEVPSPEQQDRINTSMEVMTADRLSSQEAPNDSKGRPKRYSVDTRFPAADLVEL